MARIPYVFNQLADFLPRDFFDRLVKKHNGNHYIKNYSCWNHLMVMLWAQLTSRRSLRDIESSLRAHSDKTYRMGIGAGVSRNNIANANSRRSVSIYRGLAQEMMRRCSLLSVRDKRLKLIGETFGINGFFAIDSSSVSLDLGRFGWSVPQEGYGGIKLHTMYDLVRSVPRMCLVTGHEERDQTFMEHYAYERGCFYVLDRLYFKSRGLYAIASSGAYFITRLKRNVLVETVCEHPADGKHALSDQTVRLCGRWAHGGYPDEVRRIRFYCSERNEVLDFVTNNFEVDPATIALLYRYRWQIELFFKWIKQHLRITSFFGTSANAVMTQIYVAYTSYCLLAIAADALGFNGTLYEFSNMISVSLTEKIHLTDLMGRYRRMPLFEPGCDTQLTFDF